MLAQPFRTWHVRSTTATVQLRVTKKGEAQVSTTVETDQPIQPDRSHDRSPERLLEPSDPYLVALGISDAEGRVKPTRQAKLRQVEEFCRLLSSAVDEALAAGHLRTPTPDRPLRVVDLGCGNAYLTFAAHRWLTGVRGLPVVMTGIDVRAPARERNADLAARVGADGLTFVESTIADAELPEPPDVVLALHACDTATDEALARALEWEAPLVLAAPCCHHHLQAQLKRQQPPEPYALLTRHGILRERLADTLTDALRASLVRMHGYRVDVVEFVGSDHTPRNTLAARGAHGGTDAARGRHRVRRAGGRLAGDPTARRAGGGAGQPGRRAGVLTRLRMPALLLAMTVVGVGGSQACGHRTTPARSRSTTRAPASRAGSRSRLPTPTCSTPSTTRATSPPSTPSTAVRSPSSAPPR